MDNSPAFTLSVGLTGVKLEVNSQSFALLNSITAQSPQARESLDEIKAQLDKAYSEIASLMGALLNSAFDDAESETVSTTTQATIFYIGGEEGA